MHHPIQGEAQLMDSRDMWALSLFRNQKFHIFAGSVSIFATCFETEIGENVKAAIKGEDKNDG